MKLRKPRNEDIPRTGQIIFDAFRSIAEKHKFPYDFPTLDSAVSMAEMSIGNPGIYGVVAEQHGKLVGSNFLWEFDQVKGVGPITIAPDTQSKGIGRKLMEDVIKRANGAKGIRLVQDSFNGASLALYSSLGFDVVEPLVLVEGSPTSRFESNGTVVRSIRKADLDACSALAQKLLGYDRNNELRQIAERYPGYVAERGNRIVGYASVPSIWQLNHAVAEDTDDLKAILSGAAFIGKEPLSFLLPIRQAELFRWCLSAGLRVVKPMNLMAKGKYKDPLGAFLPSVLY